MLIATYVVTKPSNREETLWAILKGIAEVSEVELTIESIDAAVCEEKKIKFMVRQSAHDGFSFHLFIGFTFEGSKQYAVNVSVPPWDEAATVKLSPIPEVLQ